jgi:muramoyltetrapeptide carboxypeptidase
MKRAKKPRYLEPGAAVSIVSPASPSSPKSLSLGLAELRRLGCVPVMPKSSNSFGYFSAPTARRVRELNSALADIDTSAVVCTRGGYGSNYLLDPTLLRVPSLPKILVGYSDLTSLQIYLWQKHGWVTFYGPMVASGLAGGAGGKHGYDEVSARAALTDALDGWSLNLGGQTISPGDARGVLLGGCMTLVQTTLGTPWELDTRGAILLLEDRGMKPYQVDNALMHLHNAGKFNGVRGIILGEFPDCEPATKGSPTVKEVCRRILRDMRIPIVWGARVGHTQRPMLTLPLGVRARLHARGAGKLDILEPAVAP